MERLRDPDYCALFDLSADFFSWSKQYAKAMIEIICIISALFLAENNWWITSIIRWLMISFLWITSFAAYVSKLFFCKRLANNYYILSTLDLSFWFQLRMFDTIWYRFSIVLYLKDTNDVNHDLTSDLIAFKSVYFWHD